MCHSCCVCWVLSAFCGHLLSWLFLFECFNKNIDRRRIDITNWRGNSKNETQIMATTIKKKWKKKMFQRIFFDIWIEMIWSCHQVFFYSEWRCKRNEENRNWLKDIDKISNKIMFFFSVWQISLWTGNSVGKIISENDQIGPRCEQSISTWKYNNITDSKSY